MKNHLIFLFAALCVPWNAGYSAQVDICTTKSGFLKTCTNGQQCCPNGNYKLNYSCPTGWTLFDTTCHRTETSGSDDTGYYTQNYGTCTANSTREDCCDVGAGADKTCIVCFGGLL